MVDSHAEMETNLIPPETRSLFVGAFVQNGPMTSDHLQQHYSLQLGLQTACVAQTTSPNKKRNRNLYLLRRMASSVRATGFTTRNERQ